MKRQIGCGPLTRRLSAWHPGLAAAEHAMRMHRTLLRMQAQPEHRSAGYTPRLLGGGRLVSPHPQIKPDQCIATGHGVPPVRRALCTSPERAVTASAPRYQPRVQIKQHKGCPAHMSIPGATQDVNAFKLVAITGDRFLDDVHSSAPASDCLDNCECESAQGVSAAEAAAADTLVAIIEGRAPARLLAQQVVDLARAAQLHNAGVVLEALPAYIEPLFVAEDGLPLSEVRIKPMPGCFVYSSACMASCMAS